MQENFERFKSKLFKEIGSEVLSAGLIGSHHGIEKPFISDIDIVILDRDTQRGKDIFKVVREIEFHTLDTTHSPLTDFLQRHFLVSDDFHGIHLILLGENELDDEYKPRSARLKILTFFFISLKLFLFRLNKDLEVIYGIDYFKLHHLPKPKFDDRLKAFSFPFIIMFFSLFTIFDRKKFIIWILKCLKYHYENIQDYFELAYGTSFRMYELEELIKYRYRPEEVGTNRLRLLFTVIGLILLNVKFIYDPNKFLKSAH